LYNKCKDEERDWKAELENRPESDYRSIKLFLYYTQMGRCMYSGKQIDLGELANTDIYDRDHIYPQSKTKDDSINNLVLVDKRINAMKSDGLISTDIQQKMSSFWRFLRDQEFIDKEKYNRLMRRTPLTDEELANFINRQLVETRQSTKFVAEALKTIYPNTEIVYVKSKLAAEFRDENLNMVKVRSINDLHHAKDAYLNIVVGNVYHEKFTSNPLNWLKRNKDKTYSLNRVFDFDLIKNEKVVWKRGKDGSIATVKKFMNKNDILYTRYSTINKDALFNQQIVSKDDNPSIPIKKGLDPLKYGGYKSITPAYFSLVESIDKKGNKQRSIEAVPLYLLKEIEKDKQVFINYCIEQYKLNNPKIIIDKIKKNTLFEIDGFPMHLKGTTGNQLLMQNAVQLIVNKDTNDYIKKIEKYLDRHNARRDKKSIEIISEFDGISKEKNEVLYKEFLLKLKETIYKRRTNNQCENLINKEEKFKYLSVEEQCLVLNEIIHIFQCNVVLSNLTMINLSKSAGVLLNNKFISNSKAVFMIDQSISGLFQKKTNLLIS
ncbi:MAG: type II CRISPR RNA-guided endonuclease Cas9, partial [Bacteroidaceae bacterium]|nr:type II CRISPR RNA-guided endonuclease Cas9 [Bacteroidaceae bacterium]